MSYFESSTGRRNVCKTRMPPPPLGHTLSGSQASIIGSIHSGHYKKKYGIYGNEIDLLKIKSKRINHRYYLI